MRDRARRDLRQHRLPPRAATSVPRRPRGQRRCDRLALPECRRDGRRSGAHIHRRAFRGRAFGGAARRHDRLAGAARAARRNHPGLFADFGGLPLRRRQRAFDAAAFPGTGVERPSRKPDPQYRGGPSLPHRPWRGGLPASDRPGGGDGRSASQGGRRRDTPRNAGRNHFSACYAAGEADGPWAGAAFDWIGSH